MDWSVELIDMVKLYKQLTNYTITLVTRGTVEK